MAAITWTETLALQQPRMDTTHREFVDLLNTVEQALEGPVDALKAALDRFTDHTVEHFAQEDAWMAQLGFAAENCHGFQHQSVLQVVQEVQRRLHADDQDAALVRDLVPGLAQWFPIHAQSMDAALAMTMQEHGFDAETGSFARAVDASAAPITGCGGSSCG
jgi:hemerythrin-like metal-binding protein